MDNQYSEVELVRRISAGDGWLFELVVKRYQDRILRLCCGMLDVSSAEDAAQETFIKAYQSLENFKGNSALGTWLHRIAVNLCLDKIAAQKRGRAESLEVLGEKEWDLPEALQAREPFLRRLEERETIEAVFKKMSPDYKTILILREVQGFNYQEISEILGISIDAVKIRLFRARKDFIRLAQDSV